jgi:hypothetical protein
MINQIEKEADIKKRKELAQLIMYMMYVMVGFFGFLIIFGYLYRDLSVFTGITYLSITIILFITLYYVHINFVKYTITVIETRNRWSENRIDIDGIKKVLYSVISILVLLILGPIIQIELSTITFIILLTLLFMIWLFLSVKKIEKKFNFWESKSYQDLTFKETIEKIDRILVKNDIKYNKIENEGTKFFTFDSYDYLYNLETGIQLKIFFPIKNRSKFNPILIFHIRLGPKNPSDKIELASIKSLLDSVLEEE